MPYKRIKKLRRDYTATKTTLQETKYFIMNLVKMKKMEYLIVRRSSRSHARSIILLRFKLQFVSLF